MRKHQVLLILFCCFSGMLFLAFTPVHLRMAAISKISDNLPQALRPVAATGPKAAASLWSRSLIDAGRAQIGVTVIYDGAYQGMSYPGGDIEPRRGVCTDVVIRALRTSHAIDLQMLVHQDMRSAFSLYPTTWGLSRPDQNIDHRRVPNLRRFFERIGAALPVPDSDSDTPTVFLPGDIVTWSLGPGKPHIGVISDLTTDNGARPLVIHNVGAGTREEDFLIRYPITGHYRLEGHV